MKTALFQDVAILLVDSHHGIYSGQMLADAISFDQWKDLSKEDYETLLFGPEHDDYIEAWATVSGKEFTGMDGIIYTVYESEDIWAIPSDVEIIDLDEMSY